MSYIQKDGKNRLRKFKTTIDTKETSIVDLATRTNELESHENNIIFVDQDDNIVDHGDASLKGSLAWSVNSSTDDITVILLGDKTYYISQDVNVPSNVNLEFKKGTVVDTTFKSLVNDNYQWTPSDLTGEFYIELYGGGNPNITEPGYIYETGYGRMGHGTAGTLLPGQWDYGDWDSLGFNTIYVRLSDDTDPDTKDDNYLRKTFILNVNGKIESGVFKIAGNNLKVIGGQVLTKSSSYTLTRGEIVHVDTSEGSVTLWCPSDPVDGDRIGIRDKASNFGTNSATLVGNGSLIYGDTSFTFDVTDRPADFEFNIDRGEWIFATR